MDRLHDAEARDTPGIARDQRPPRGTARIEARLARSGELVEAGEAARAGPVAVQEHRAGPLAPHPHDRTALRPPRLEPWKGLGVACRGAGAETPRRADGAGGAPLEANGRAELHHRLVVVAGVGGIDELLRERRERPRSRRAVPESRPVPADAGQDPDHVAIHACDRLAEGDARHRGRGVGADAGKLLPSGRGARQAPGARHRPGEPVQVAGARVVAQALPELKDPGLGGRREGPKVRQRLHPAAEVGQDGGHLRLLEHELAHDGPVGRGRLAPGEGAPARPVPGQQGALEGRAPRHQVVPGGSFACHWRHFCEYWSVMPKRGQHDEENPKALSTYTLKLDGAQMERLRSILSGRGWESFDVAYARYAFRGRDCNVTAYESGKLVVAGKGTEEFVTMTLEPEVTKRPQLGYDEVHHPEWFEPHAGLDESGKGDLFGPVVAAT